MTDWFTEWFDADYAALYAHRDEAEAELAVRTALARVPELTAGPVLDLACGSGRHLTHLRRANPEAIGLDLSADLLALAPRDLRPWLVRGDMRHLPVRHGALAGITLWFTPFGYFSDATNRALLHQLGELLRPGGALLLDLFSAAHLARTLVPEDFAEREGLRVHSLRAIEGRHVVKRMTLTRLATGATREVVERVRIYRPEELEAMAGEAGLALSDAWGGYGGEAFEPGRSARWIGVFRLKVNG